MESSEPAQGSGKNTRLPIRIIKQLKKYEEMRAKKEVTIISEEKLRAEIDLSVKIFNDITKLLFI